MKESGKKAYEIAYALWRVAEHSPEKTFSGILRDKAFELISFAAKDDYHGANAAIDGLELAIKFAVDVNAIGVSNAAILVREIGNLKSAIQSAISENPAIGNSYDNDVDLSDIFTPTVLHQKPAVVSSEDNESENENDSGNRAAIRQSAILERIRQSGNCRIGDIQAMLPDTSERTLRYDLESLVQRNLIERVGAGGRSVFYRSIGVVNSS